MKQLTTILLLLLWGCEITDGPATTDELPCEPPVLVIHAAIDALSYNEKSWCYTSYIDSNGDTVFSELKTEVKYRGQSHNEHHKRSYTLELSKSFEVEKLRSDDDWLLISSYTDKSFMRNKLAYDLFREMGNPAPESSYINVVQNNSYEGLFLLCEPVDAKQLDLDKTDPASFIFKEPNLFQTPDQIDRVKGLEDGPYFAASEQKHPDPADSDMSGVLAELQWLIHEAPDSAFTDPHNGIPALFDLDNIIDWHLLLLVANHSNGVAGSYYLYRQNARSRIKVCPWDYDNTFGRTNQNNPNWDTKTDLLESSPFFARLLELNPENYTERLIARYKELVAQDVFTPDYLHREIDDILAHIEPYLEANFTRWPENSETYYDNNSTEEELYLMRNWIDAHFEYLDGYIKSLQTID